MAGMGLITLGNCFLSVTKSQMLAFGHKWYGRPSLATAVLVYL